MEIVQTSCKANPILAIYGPPGAGKTTLASKFPKPLFLLLEQGVPQGTTVAAIANTANYESVMTALAGIHADPNGYQTLVIDTLDSLEGRIHADLCEKSGWKDIETPSYGKGYVRADAWWRRVLRGLDAIRDKCNMTILLLAHSSIERVDDPRAASYTSCQMRLHKRARALVMDACDGIFFLSPDLRVVTDDSGFRERTRAVSDSRRFLFTEGQAAFAAKSRFRMPARIPIPLEFDIATLTAHFQPKEEPTHE
jgi:hypothetical protein